MSLHRVPPLAKLLENVLELGHRRIEKTRALIRFHEQQLRNISAILSDKTREGT